VNEMGHGEMRVAREAETVLRRLASFQDIAEETGLPLHSLYRAYRAGAFSGGIACRLGRRLFMDRERFADFIADGGQAAPGAEAAGQ
jgi:hypothetical protein